MKNKISRITLVITIIIIFTSFLSGCLSRPYTPEIKDENGNIIQDSVTILESIEIGGMKQWIQIRGHNINDPILLWLHGGPGSAQMPVGRFFNGELEEHFIVVHWDQRGAGKSNPSDFDESTMTLDQFVSDAHELTSYLKERFNKNKIFILGHSWGTYIGLQLAVTYPDDYYAYIAQGQVLNYSQACIIGYEWLLEVASDIDIDILNGLNGPPYKDHSEFVTYIQMIEKYGGGMDSSMIEMLPFIVRATEYTLEDYQKWLDGANRGAGIMWDEYLKFNLSEECPEIHIPIYFLSGVNDYNTPVSMVIEYYESIKATMGKYLIIFENCSHAPCLGNPEQFNSKIIEIKENI